MLTVRLPPDLEQRLVAFARYQHKSKSEVIKEALEKMLAQEQVPQDSYTLGEAYFGRYESHDGTLSVTYKDKLKGKLNAKFDSH
ncbi:ribbon-helix-helix domain-containing protein [Acinetobacter populi]|jgi:predicted transcriptional regulator|uniref:CopG family transcriptional regulator n=1 Tax=Acinetobacter populi TaxID=1582270 RepID=A0A1Z9Z1L0_9GAMM|nr:ribbon-helix-helix domain-containing protein [Acinetobacter populi]MCH4246293.1 ribbon-helix-helix domain-containing protein [Acinetobacter populi]OUY08340.1 CopG family transcriptional regulator [Acinetobacter populi]